MSWIKDSEKRGRGIAQAKVSEEYLKKRTEIERIEKLESDILENEKNSRSIFESYLPSLKTIFRDLEDQGYSYSVKHGETDWIESVPADSFLATFGMRRNHRTVGIDGWEEFSERKYFLGTISVFKKKKPVAFLSVVPLKNGHAIIDNIEIDLNIEPMKISELLRDLISKSIELYVQEESSEAPEKKWWKFWRD